MSTLAFGQSQHATGTFEVKITPAASSNPDGNVTLGRNALEKTFQGDLTGTSKGEMLTALTQTKGSAGYVAIEHASATLRGRKGGFALQHTGTMSHGTQSLSITVVPDSGSGDLTGISGQMTIRIEGGKHFYDFEYTLPDR